MPHRRKLRIALIKAFLLGIFVLMAFYLVRFTPVREWFTAASLNAFLAGTGGWAPVLFILVFGIGTTLFVPYLVLSGFGVLLFGVYAGLFYVWAGAMAGSIASFLIGRTLGRDFAAHLIGDRLRKYDDGIERHGFTTVLYLRLIYLPFAALNYGIGLTKVRFRDYVMGTALAMFVETIIFIFLINALKEAWQTSAWQPLWSWQVLFAVGLFVFSLFIPRIMRQLVEKPVQPEPAIWNAEVRGNPDTTS